MSAFLVAIVAMIYAGIAISQLRQAHYGDFLIWVGYVIGNIGFLWKYMQ
jgi:hypothetical protein